MQARDIMVSPVITVMPHSSVQEAAKIFLEKRISAVPVVDDQGKLMGIVSEGDLIHRGEADTEKHRPWWLAMFLSTETLANEYAKAHACRVSDIMTTVVVTASPTTPLHEIARLMEKNAIKRVPIIENGALVGIVSRANLIQAVATVRKGLEVPLSDATIRDKILAHLKAQPWAHTSLLNVTVNDGIVDIWGIAHSDAERRAIRIAAEASPGVRLVNDNMIKPPVASLMTA